MFRTTRSYSMILVVGCLVAGKASAQSADTARPVTGDTVVTSDARESAPTQAGPRIDATAVAVRQHSQLAAVSEPFALQRRSNSMGKPVAMMIVGGAAIVLGAVIGDGVGTLFMIGGSVSVLIGLYEYLK